MTASVSGYSGEDEFGTVMVYTLEPCAPCEIVKEALKLLDDDARNLGWKIQIVPTISGDKKGIGAAYLAGVRNFPTVKLVRDRRAIKSFVSVREGWTSQDVASFLRSEIEAETKPINMVGNDVRVAR
jgi:hypothetical protein